jgi:hypothetical protein
LKIPIHALWIAHYEVFGLFVLLDIKYVTIPIIMSCAPIEIKIAQEYKL